ncbi:MAG: NADH-quinone oxidoreductase subunit L [Candidatus Odinarchaeota archaeon]|nr:NADH-quinone oxidoreductase subunit L [Candidatus Odinarchaeota archaeon]
MLPYAPWLAWLIPLISAILMPVLNKLGKKIRDYSAIGAIFLSVIFSFSLVLDVLYNKAYDILTGETLGTIPYDWEINWLPIGDVNGDGVLDYITAGVLVDPLSVFMMCIVSFIGLLIMIYSLGYMHGEPDMVRYWFWMDFFIGSMLLLVSADNLLQMFYGWEMVGVCSWQLISFWYKSKNPSDDPRFSTEGAYNAHCGLKAFIVTSFGDIFLVIAIAVIGFATWVAFGVPTFNFMKLAQKTGWIGELAHWGILSIVSIFLFTGPIGKSAQFPLQEWLPEAMAGPTTVSALIHAATMVKAGVYLVARILPIFYAGMGIYDGLATFFTVVAWIGAITAFIAATDGLVARELKKVLAFSTISQLGYMMLALGAAGLSGTLAYTGYLAGTFHLMAHAIFKALLFLCAGVVIHTVHTKYMDQMGGLKEHMPTTYKTMLIGAASLSGIPPFAGFFSKELIFTALWSTDLLALFIVAGVVAVLTPFYSFRMIGLTFFGPKSEHVKKIEKEHGLQEAPKVMTVPLWILAILTIITGFTGPLAERFFEPVITSLGAEHITSLEELYVEYLIHSFTSITTLISLVLISIGFFPAYYIYIKRKADPKAIVENNALLRGIYTLLYNRWYWNALYYKIGRAAIWVANRIRKVQTGVLNINVLGMLLGFAAMLIYILLMFM